MLRYILYNYHKGNRPREFCCGSVVKALAYETGFLDCNPDLSSASRLAAKLFLGPIPTSSKSALRQYNSIDSDAATFILRQWKWNQDMIAAAVNQVNSNYWLGLEESLQLEFKVSFDKNAALCNKKKIIIIIWKTWHCCCLKRVDLETSMLDSWTDKKHYLESSFVFAMYHIETLWLRIT